MLRIAYDKDAAYEHVYNLMLPASILHDSNSVIQTCMEDTLYKS